MVTDRLGRFAGLVVRRVAEVCATPAGTALAVAALLLVILTTSGAPASVLRFDAGSPGDDAVMSAFFPAERNATETYRWSESDASIRLPVSVDGPVRVTLALATAGGGARELRVACGVTGSTLSMPSEGQFTMILDCRPRDNTLDLTLSVAAVRIPGDGRPLGVAVREAGVEALSSGDRIAWRLRAALLAAALVAGLTAAASATGIRHAPIVTALAASAAVLAVAVVAPATLLALLRGPAGPLTLAAGLAALALHAGARGRAGWLALLGTLALVLLPQPPLIKTLPGRWTAGDPTALAIVPWLALGALVSAVLLGGSRARWLAALAAGLAAASAALPLVARELAARWSATLAVPDWTDEVSVGGGLLLALVVLTGVTATFAASRAALAGSLATAAVVALVLAPLVAWRDARVLLNGDEPHYYVTARSIADDRDLELLDDYLDPAYRRETISPDGNIALRRDVSVDRVSAWTPAQPGRWQLVPPAETGLRSDVVAGTSPHSGAPIVVVTSVGGHREGLPALEAAPALGIALPGSCDPRWVVVGSPSGDAIDVQVAVLAIDGAVVASERLRSSVPVAALPLAIPAEQCDDDGALAITLKSANGPIVAQAIDLRFGLRIAPARPLRGAITLVALPRDNVATVSALAEVALFNPTTRGSEVTLTARGASDDTLLATRLQVAPGTSRVVRLPLPGTSGIVIAAPDGIVVGGVGSLASGTWPLVEPAAANSWRVTLPPSDGADTGVWLSVIATGSRPAQLVIHDTHDHAVELCAGCATIVGLRSDDLARAVDVEIVSGEARLAALAWAERTSSLHFDPGFPAAIALPARLAGPSAAFATVAALAVALAAGIWLGLRRLGVDSAVATTGAAATVLLAPVSPFATRLYTEVPAACLIVWALVAWDAGRRDRRWLAASALLALALPLIHGRYLPATLVLLALIAWQLPRRWPHPRPTVVVLLAFATIAVALVEQFAIGVHERLTLDYLDPAWLPHTLAGALLDRGSGLLPVAPWLLLALAARRLAPIQVAALAVASAQALALLLRDGGWQTWGPPGRYLLPSAVLLAFVAVPGATRLWHTAAGRAIVVLLKAWSIAMAALLHWIPLAGYAGEGTYPIDTLPLARWTPFALFPALRPATSGALLSALLLGLLAIALALVGWRIGARRLRVART